MPIMIQVIMMLYHDNLNLWLYNWLYSGFDNRFLNIYVPSAI